MIRIERIPDISITEYDEVWWIVRSPDSLPKEEKLVQSLAPSKELFLRYRKAFHAGQFDPEFFQKEYVPQFVSELLKMKRRKRCWIKYFLSDIASVQKDYDALIQRIVSELLKQAAVYNWDGIQGCIESFDILPDDYQDVTLDDLQEIPEAYRPDLTGTLYKKDIAENTSSALLYEYKMYLENTNPKIKQQFYNMFRQGFDILDLYSLTYKIIDQNRNSMGYWLPTMTGAVKNQDFFKIPATKILKVPLSLLQLTRQEYTALTPATMRIVDEFCYKAFGLEPDKEYFIKTGTFSSKFDFRNAHVVGEKEVNELGEYLLFIHYQALCHAHYDLSGRN